MSLSYDVSLRYHFESDAGWGRTMQYPNLLSILGTIYCVI